MRRVVGYSSLPVFIMCVFAPQADATSVSISNQISGNYVMSGSTTIEAPNGALMDGTIFVNTLVPVYIKNDGTITSDLNVCDNCIVYIENTGTFNATAVLPVTSTITQVIKNEADITTLSNIGVAHNVWIDNNDDVLNWNDIVTNTPQANGYILEYSKIRINGVISVDNVTVNGRVFVYTNNIPDTGTALFTHVSGDGRVYIFADEMDPMFVLETYNVGGDNLFARVVRSKDYERILNNNSGRFLNLLREQSPESRLLARMDSVQTLGELKDIMSKSIHVNPIKLMQSIRTMYMHKTLETMHIEHESSFEVMPFSVFSKDMLAFGIEPRLNIKLSDDLWVKMSGRVSSLDYSDNINEYNAVSYGVGADVIYGFSDNNFLRAYGDISFSSFDSGIVFDGNAAVENPNGFSGYMAGELGHQFHFIDKLYFAPFLIVGADYATVLKQHESNYFTGIGGDVGYSFDFDGLRYGYSGRLLVRSDGDMGSELGVSVWSLSDNAGADFKIGAFYDETIGVSYNVSLNVMFGF